MYNDLFGLCKDPFSLAPDPSFLFLTDQHRETLSGLSLAILQHKGLVVLIGDAGTGKTTLLARILRFLPESRLQFSMIQNPTLTPSEFLEFALLNFGVADVPSSKAERLFKLLNVILQGRREGKVSALIVDEAHKLSPEVLEEIRMLGNLEDPDDRFLQILLVGQPELDQALNREDARQLKRRIGVRLTLGPLDPSEVGEYMRHRWLRAGGTELPFTPQAIDEIARASQSIPRLINSLCDNALLAAFAAKSPRVQDCHVREAAASLDLCQASPLEEIVQLEPHPPMPISILESKPSPWNRLTGRLRLTPRHESM
jgi:general secretion pathway protein A